MATYITKIGDVVDEIVWEFYGYQDKQAVEQVLEANPGLADLGTVLDAGVRIELPDLVRPETVKGLKLWD